jgi:indole-3-glycerol phosphate synthase
MAFLDEILKRKAAELNVAKTMRTVGDLKKMIRDAPAVRPFAAAFGREFGLIAEIKRRSPSGGDMRQENVDRAAAVYAQSPAVKAISVLTNTADFGMGMEDLSRVKAQAHQPVLRKDFIFEEYQIYEARAFGADALLLMVNVLDRERLRGLFELSSELKMDVLFEAHTKAEIDLIPEGAKLYGINSRKFKTSSRWFLTKLMVQLGLAKSGKGPDLSVDLETFALIQHLPSHAIKIAESGLKPEQIPQVIRLGYNAVLVGTSLLKAEEGIERMLTRFENALSFVPESREN